MVTLGAKKALISSVYGINIPLMKQALTGYSAI